MTSKVMIHPSCGPETSVFSPKSNSRDISAQVPLPLSLLSGSWVSSPTYQIAVSDALDPTDDQGTATSFDVDDAVPRWERVAL